MIQLILSSKASFGLLRQLLYSNETLSLEHWPRGPSPHLIQSNKLLQKQKRAQPPILNIDFAIEGIEARRALEALATVVSCLTGRWRTATNVFAQLSYSVYSDTADRIMAHSDMEYQEFGFIDSMPPNWLPSLSLLWQQFQSFLCNLTSRKMFSPQRKASVIHFSCGPRCRIKRQFSWGHLNLNRLDTNKWGGKILKDLEDGFGLECLIANPTRITKLSSTLIDVILTKRPDIFTEGGTYNP